MIDIRKDIQDLITFSRLHKAHLRACEETEEWIGETEYYLNGLADAEQDKLLEVLKW